MLNSSLFSTINSFAGHSVWLDRLGVFLAADLTYILVGVLILASFWYRKSWGKWLFVEALGSVFIARGIITEGIRFFYHHPRPFLVAQVHQLIPETGWSFPSGHMTFLFAIAMTTWFYNRKLGYTLFASSLLVGIARVYVGVHWPFDIVGGIIVGIFTAIVWHQIIGIYLKRKIQTRV